MKQEFINLIRLEEENRILKKNAEYDKRYISKLEKDIKELKKKIVKLNIKLSKEKSLEDIVVFWKNYASELEKKLDEAENNLYYLTR